LKYVLAIFALGVLIIVHELGHFILAKINKVKVIEFSIGMGPKIFTYKGKETNYSLSLLPVGGYVQMLGAQEESDEEGSFTSKSPFRRITIIVAGVVMNFLMAIVIFTAVTCNFGFTDTVIKEMVKDGPLIEAGIQANDEVVSINNSKIITYNDIGIEMSKNTGEEVSVEYLRDGVKQEVIVKPKYVDDEGGKRYILGALFNRVDNPTIVQGVKQSFKQSGTLITQTIKTLTKLVTGQGNFKTDLGGPVTVVNLSAGAAEAGIWELVNLVGILSISLAVFNFLPFPILDGGWTVLLLIELITKRKVPEKIVNAMNTVGIVLLMALMVIVTIKDIIFPSAY
jgi:regulator of sigma E protease